nr:MAG TPA: hypothetical protein [Caudoviricetes sp.]
MPAYKDKKTGLFYVQFYYRDARGTKRYKTKKGFQPSSRHSCGRRTSRPSRTTPWT